MLQESKFYNLKMLLISEMIKPRFSSKIQIHYKSCNFVKSCFPINIYENTSAHHTTQHLPTLLQDTWKQITRTSMKEDLDFLSLTALLTFALWS